MAEVAPRFRTTTVLETEARLGASRGADSRGHVPRRTAVPWKLLSGSSVLGVGTLGAAATAATVTGTPVAASGVGAGAGAAATGREVVGTAVAALDRAEEFCDSFAFYVDPRAVPQEG